MSARATVLILYACGLAAAAGLGKFAALVPAVRGDLGLGLTAAAWLTSLIEAGGASLGLVAGVLVGRLGVRRPLLGGLLVLALAALGEGLVADAVGLFGFRALESLGYLAVVVAAPTWIAAATAGGDRAAALALWSTFVPVGMALGAGLAGLGADLLPWRGVVVAAAAPALALAVVAARLPPTATPPRRSKGRAGGGAALWLAAIGFGAYTTLQVGLLALLPAFLVDAHGLGEGAAGLAVAIVSLANVPGGLAAGRLVARGASPSATVAAALAASALMMPAIYAEGIGATLAVAAAIVANVALGLVPAVVFARMPVLADGATAFANGLLAQFGASGSLVGPPLVAAAVGRFGWVAAGVVLVALAAAAGALVLLAEARHRRAGRTAGEALRG